MLCLMCSDWQTVGAQILWSTLRVKHTAQQIKLWILQKNTVEFCSYLYKKKVSSSLLAYSI